MRWRYRFSCRDTTKPSGGSGWKLVEQGKGLEGIPLTTAGWTQYLIENLGGAVRVQDPNSYSKEPISGESTSFSQQQPDRKFKHAADFGVATTKKSPGTLGQFGAAIESHLNSKHTEPHGTYGVAKDSKAIVVQKQKCCSAEQCCYRIQAESQHDTV